MVRNVMKEFDTAQIDEQQRTIGMDESYVDDMEDSEKDLTNMEENCEEAAVMENAASNKTRKETITNLDNSQGQWEQKEQIRRNSKNNVSMKQTVKRRQTKVHGKKKTKQGLPKGKRAGRT